MNDVQTLIESAGDDPYLAAELLELFKEQGDEGIAHLADAVERNDTEQTVYNAHKLVGSAVACGFIRLSQELRFIELHCKCELPADIGLHIETVKQLLKQGCMEMKQLLADEKLYEKGADN